MNIWRICDRCTMRNCRRTPKQRGVWSECYKRKPIQDGWSLLELAVGTSPAEVVDLAWRYGMRVKETNGGGFKLVAIPKGG